MHLKVIKSQQCSVERSHVVLKLILNSDQGLAFIRQKQIVTGLLVTKIYKKRKDFFIQLVYARLHLTNSNFPTFISIEEILDQPMFLNPHTRMDFKRPIQEYFKFPIVRDLCRFLLPGLTSSTIFHKHFTTFSYCQPYKIFKLIMGSIPNDQKHLLRTETFQKSLLKFFLLQQ